MPGWLATIQAATWIALIGWAVTAGGWLISQRAQRKLFVHQVRNAARGELVSALRTEQGVMGELKVAILVLDLDRQQGRTENQPQEKWKQEFERFQRIASRSDVQWIFLLEQYEVLFPETSVCRLGLVERARRVKENVTAFFVGVQRDQTRAAALQGAQSLMDQLADQGALIEDLLVHVQNATLGAVVGQAVPFRQPPDASVPRIVLRKGRLTIVNGQGEQSSVLKSGA